MNVDTAISNYFTQWLGQHPYLAWSISHPLASVGLLLLVIFSLSGLIKAIGRGFEQIWLWILKTPFKLLQPILEPLWRAIYQRIGNNSSSVGLSTSDSSVERVNQIIDRLQTLTTEQEVLLRELSTLRATNIPDSPSANL